MAGTRLACAAVAGASSAAYCAATCCTFSTYCCQECATGLPSRQQQQSICSLATAAVALVLLWVLSSSQGLARPAGAFCSGPGIACVLAMKQPCHMFVMWCSGCCLCSCSQRCVPNVNCTACTDGHIWPRWRAWQQHESSTCLQPRPAGLSSHVATLRAEKGAIVLTTAGHCEGSCASWNMTGWPASLLQAGAVH